MFLALACDFELRSNQHSKSFEHSPQCGAQTTQKIGPPLDSSGRADVCSVACQHEGQRGPVRPPTGG